MTSVDRPDAEGETPEQNPYHVTLDQLAARVHVPAEQQVIVQPDDRNPASTDLDEVVRQLGWAGRV